LLETESTCEELNPGWRIKLTNNDEFPFDEHASLVIPRSKGAPFDFARAEISLAAERRSIWEFHGRRGARGMP